MFFKQKLILYFDENFPLEIIEIFKHYKTLRKKYKTITVFDRNNQGKDDNYQLNYCKKQKYILTTVDKDYWNDAKFPISKIPGIIIVGVINTEYRKIIRPLIHLLDFLQNFPRPKDFCGNSKFKVSTNTCIMRGRHTKTQEIIEYTFKPDDTDYKIGKIFGYYI